MPIPTDFSTLFIIVAVIGFLQLPFTLYFRQQARTNPARQTAFNEPVMFQAHVAVRTRWPTRVWRPNHWYFANSNVTDIFVRTSTVQISSSILRRQGRRYGCFLASSGTTMWLSYMRPFVMARGRQQCIVLSGTVPFRGQDREVQQAVFSHDRTQDIWNALAASGVRGVAAPVGGEAPAREMQAVGPSPGWGSTVATPGPPPPPSPPAPHAPQIYAPPFARAPQRYAPQIGAPYAPDFDPPSKRSVWPFVAAGVFVCSPLLLGFIISHVSRHQGELQVVVTGPVTVATVSNVACASNGNGQIDLSGTITAVTAAPLGLTIHGSTETESGAPVGLGGSTPAAPLTQGQSEKFQSIFEGFGIQNPDRCVITWSANTPSS